MPELRRAAEPDLPSIGALARWVWCDRYVEEGLTPAVARYLDEHFAPAVLGAHLAQQPHWVAKSDDGALIGWAQLDAGSAGPDLPAGAVELQRLYVLPTQQRRGLGRRLLRQARGQWPARPLWLSVWEGNGDALRFYRREGGELWGETWFELDGQRHRNLVLGWPPLEARRT